MTSFDTAALRIAEPRELLAYVPYHLGFQPQDSFVAIGLRGPGRPVGLTLRIDLEAFAGGSSRSAAEEVLAHLERDGAIDAVGIVYSSADRAALHREPAVANLLRAVRAACDWFDPPGPWVVTPGGYGPWGWSETCAAPIGSHEDLRDSRIAAAMVFQGRAVEGDRADLAPPPAPPGPELDTAVAAADAAAGELSRQVIDPSPDWQAWVDRMLHDWWRALALATEGREVSPAILGRLSVGLMVSSVRDVVLSRLVLPEAGDATATLTREGMLAACTPGGPAPREQIVGPAERVLTDVAGHARPHRTSAAACLAWLSWWRGDGARAAVLTEQCLDRRPEDGLAGVMADVLAHGMPPGWASR